MQVEPVRVTPATSAVPGRRATPASSVARVENLQPFRALKETYSAEGQMR